MNDVDQRILLPLILRFFDHVVRKAEFSRKSEVETLFNWIRSQLPICSMMFDGQRMMAFAHSKALDVKNEGDFRRLLRQVWEAARDVDAANRHRLLVFFVGAGAITGRLLMSARAPDGAKVWIETTEAGIAALLGRFDPGKKRPKARKKPRRQTWSSGFTAGEGYRAWTGPVKEEEKTFEEPVWGSYRKSGQEDNGEAGDAKSKEESKMDPGTDKCQHEKSEQGAGESEQGAKEGAQS